MDRNYYQNFLLTYAEGRLRLEVMEDRQWREKSLPRGTEQVLINGDLRASFEGHSLRENGGDGKYILQSDPSGCVPLYYFEKENALYLSTDMDYLLQSRGEVPPYDSDKLLEYFTLSYQALDEKTIYEGIYALPVNSRILFDKQYEILRDGSSFFQNSGEKVSARQLTDILIRSTREKLRQAKPEEQVFLMTGGKDSIIGALLLKAVGAEIDCATFGYEGSLDLQLSQIRRQIIFPDSRHFTFRLDELAVNREVQEKYSRMLGGFGPYTSIYYYDFFRKLSGEGKTAFIFSDHFECIRKKISGAEEFEISYTTPPEVVERYFADGDRYRAVVQRIKAKIESRYKLDPYYEFYFYDRNCRGMFYKNVLARHWGKQKITLTNNREFLNLNYNYIRGEQAFPYDEILQNLLEINGLSGREELFAEPGGAKPIPIDPQADLRAVKDFYLQLIKSEAGDFTEELFKRDEIIRALEEESFQGKDHWFLLRLFQLLVYRNAENSDM